MVLRHTVVRVADVREGFLKVLFNLLINLRHGTAGILRRKGGLRFFHIGYADILGACGLIIVHAEHVHEDEMTVGTAHERLRLLLKERGSPLAAIVLHDLIDCLKGMVGRRNSGIARAPDVFGRLIVRFGDVLPMPKLLEELTAHVSVVELVNVITEHFCDHHIVVVRVGGSKEALNLLLTVYLGPVVRQDIKKLVA